MSKIKVISFDVYDTLINRIIPPKKIYKIIGDRLNINNFPALRLEAEEKANLESKGLFSIEDIYKYLDINDDLKETALKLEVELEIQNTIVNKVGYNLFLKYKDNYQIVCFSDMYLHKETISKILKRNGYDIDTVFVSCDIKASKRNRKGYDVISKLLSIKKRNICHIGDSIRSDFLNARLSGLKTKYIGKNNKDNYANKLDKKDYLNYIGYNYFGPTFYEFCVYINQENNLLFVSREGDLICQFFNTLFDKNEKIIFLSRRSVLSGIISNLIETDQFELAFDLASVKLNETVEEFIRRIGINNKYFANELLKSPVKDNKEKFIDIVNLNKANIINDTKDNLEIFDKYIKENISPNSTLVDIGWNGSMQNLLNVYLENYDLKGIYLGALNSENKKGYLFNEKNDVAKTILNYSGLLELILMPNYGSVMGYKELDDNVKPVFDESEFSNESLETISYIQEGILKYITDLKTITTFSIFTMNEVYCKLNKVGINPNKKDLKYLGNIEFYDNGVSNMLINKSFNFKKDFVESKWKCGFLKRLFKLNLNYNKLLNKLRK